MRRRLARLPVRVRVTAAFAVVMALVLGATGLFLYLRLAAELDESLAAGLRSRAGDVAALVEQSGSGLERSAGSSLVEQGENIAQILDSSGAIVDTTPVVRGLPLLTRAQLARHGTARSRSTGRCRWRRTSTSACSPPRPTAAVVVVGGSARGP